MRMPKLPPKREPVKREVPKCEPLRREEPNWLFPKRLPLKRDPPRVKWPNREASNRAPPNAEFPKREVESAERPIPESCALDRAKTELPEILLRLAKLEAARFVEIADLDPEPNGVMPERLPVAERPEKRPEREEPTGPAAERSPKECQPVDINEEEPRMRAAVPARPPKARVLPAVAPKPRADEFAKPDRPAKPCHWPSAMPGRLKACPLQAWNGEPARLPKPPFIPREPKRPAP